MPDRRRMGRRGRGCRKGLRPWLALALGLLVVSTAAEHRAEEEGESALRAETVVLIHGLGRSATNMLILKWRLQARGYRVCNVDYDTRVSSIEIAADAVMGALRPCVGRSRRIHFVTHSLGGLVLRAMLDRYELDPLGRAVMLAPPNHGSEIADALREFGPLAGVMGPLARQLGTRPADLPGRLPRPALPFGVIAGSEWINPAGPIFLPGPHDGTVSVASTRLEGMSDHLVLPYTHTFIMNPAEVADQVDAFLRRGCFAHPDAESVCPAED